MSSSEEKTSDSSWIRSLCCSILKSGRIPQHVAIIMDGNRRFAQKMQYSRVFMGHIQGFDKLLETLEWCLDLGITELTVYAFSIENFKRAKEEVDGLMELAKQKVTKLLDERDLIMKHGVCIRVLGDLELLPPDVLASVARAVNFSRNNNRAVLNVCFSYTSRHEMTQAVRRIVQGTAEGMILPSDISEDVVERCLYTGDSRPPDLVIRTSGEVRLSDFLLWQSSYSCLCFLEVLWPEFSIWNFFSAILTYQKNYDSIQEARENHALKLEERQCQLNKECVLMQLEGSNQVGAELEKLVLEYGQQRKLRVEQFIEHIRTEHRLFLERVSPIIS